MEIGLNPEEFIEIVDEKERSQKDCTLGGLDSKL